MGRAENDAQKIAVIIPSYRPGGYIERCFSSLQNQSIARDCFCVYICLNGPRFPYESYILDILKGFSFNYKLIFSDEVGVSFARNILIDNSEEEYIAFVDDDDVLSEDYLCGLLGVSDEKYIGVANVKVFHELISEAEENYIGKYFFRLEGVEVSKFKARKYYSSPCAKLIHRGLIGNIKFDTSLSKGEDSLFMAMISRNVLGIRKSKDDACYYVYRRAGSSSRKKVPLFSEFSRAFYLIGKYFSLLFHGGYESLFVLSRIAATLVHLGKSIVQVFRLKK